MKDAFDFLEKISAPGWIVISFGVLVVLGLVGKALSEFTGGVAASAKALRSVTRIVFRRSEDVQRLRKRQRFAKDVRRKLQLLEGKEWSDERFTELEAQVIIENNARSRFAIVDLLRPGRALRYQRSLTRALRKCREPLILLQGDPGCGKSVALRHVALKMADHAARSRRLDAIIPLYVNLKGLRRQGRAIDAQLIEEHVNASLRQDINSDIERFLDEEYERGLTDGTWFVLFDSFDEIPDILGSARLDEIVREYSLAIATYLGGMRPCHGVVASREFHSPKGIPWPTWQVKPLAAKRQRTLVRRYLIDRDKEGTLLAGLETASTEITQDASNPLFLSLLAEYVRQNDSFPLSSHDVYEAYIEQRFATDGDRIQTRYAISAKLVRAVAQRIAFCMSSEPGVGLDPTRGVLIDILERRGYAARAVAMTSMDALEYLKLVQGQANGSDPHARVFTFAHRRFQEYFASAAVLDRLGDISSDELLSNLRWRETAVALCQLQREAAAPLLERAGQILAGGVRALDPLTNEERAAAAAGESAPPEEQLDDPWPESAFEVLGILQAGFSSRPESLPPELRELAGDVLEHVFWRGLPYDRAAAVSVAIVAPRPVLDTIVRGAFKSGSQLLADEAYRQLARLRELSVDFALDIRRTLLRLCSDGTLRREALTVRAQLKRFDAPKSLLRAQRLAAAAPRIDLLVVVAGSLLLAWYAGPGAAAVVALLAVLAHISLYGFAAWLGGAIGDSMFRGASGFAWTVSARAYVIGIALLLTVSDDYWTATALAVLLLSWGPAALVAVRRGRFMHPLTCLLAFIPPAGAAVAVLRRMDKAAWSLVFKATLAGLATLAIVGVVLAAFTSLSARWQVVLFSAGAAIFCLVNARTGWRRMRRFARGVRSYRRWHAESPAELSAAELMYVLARLHSARAATRMLADVRQRGILLPDDAAYGLLRDLARAARGGPYPVDPQAWRTEDFSAWLETVPFVERAQGGPFGNAFQDEVARLVVALREQQPMARPGVAAASESHLAQKA